MKSPRPSSFWPWKSNGQWSVPSVSMRPSASAAHSAAWSDFVAQRRREHPFGAFEVRPLGVRFVERQVLDHRFDVEVVPLAAEAVGHRQRLGAAQMHHVGPRARRRREGQEFAHALGLDHRRAAGFVPLGAGLAFRKQLPLHRRNQLRVFAMRQHDQVVRGGEVQHAVQVFVADRQRRLVGQVDFDRPQALRDEFLQLHFQFVVKPLDHQVEAVVARGLARSLRLPRGPGGVEILFLARPCEIHNARRAAHQRRPRAVGIIRFRRHVRQRQIGMHMRIDESWKHQLPRRLDDRGSRRRVDLLLHRGDRLAFAPYIPGAASQRRHHLSAANQQAHGVPLISSRS